MQHLCMQAEYALRNAGSNGCKQAHVTLPVTRAAGVTLPVTRAAGVTLPGCHRTDLGSILSKLNFSKTRAWHRIKWTPGGLSEVRRRFLIVHVVHSLFSLLTLNYDCTRHVAH